MLDKRGKDVTAKVYTKNISRQLSLDFDKHNAQYAPIEVEQFDRAHDRFLCIDDTVYLIGASIKDLGKKWFGFTKIDGWTTDELLSKIWHRKLRYQVLRSQFATIKKTVSCPRR